jgi:CheY-like chemotaxis protein
MTKPVILCVDDEKTVLQSLRTQLMRAFEDVYAYEVAEDANEALEVIDELTDEGTNIILIVSDWLMPGMKGDEFLVRVHQQFPNVVKIMLTGQADELAITRAQEQANLHSCLFKPWSEDELIKTIKSGLAKLKPKNEV